MVYGVLLFTYRKYFIPARSPVTISIFNCGLVRIVERHPKQTPELLVALWITILYAIWCYSDVKCLEIPHREFSELQSLSFFLIRTDKQRLFNPIYFFPQITNDFIDRYRLRIAYYLWSNTWNLLYDFSSVFGALNADWSPKILFPFSSTTSDF